MSNNGSNPALKIIPLGGLHEIGKNTCVLEYNDEIVLLDAGLAFPTDGMHGVNIVLPDMTYLRENKHKIRGMIVTHGHEDHIGGIPFHLKQFDIPVIYGPRLAMALLAGKLEEAGVSDRTELRTVRPRDMVRIGAQFFVEYIRNTHSIADSFTVAIHTPVGMVIHTGDFKIDHTPVDGEHFDLHRLAEHGSKGVLCLISDSTNSEIPGFTASERSVYPNLDRIFSQAPGRLLVTTFASSVHRLNLILDLAARHQRTVAVVGRSMLNVIAHARNLGYLKCSDDLFQPLHGINQIPPQKILILTTGSQGEPMAALSRIANGDHRQIKIRSGDTVVFSANPIPGNTIAVVNTIDKLMMQGAKVIYGRDQGIHVSGHGCQEDQKLMIALTRPKFFLPVHGEHRMLVKHAETARSMGIPPENMVIINNGDIVELTPDSIQIGGKVPSGVELVDNTGVVNARVLKERQQLAEDGVVTVAVAISWQGELLATPEIHLRGVVTSLERSLLQRWVSEVMTETLRDRWADLARSDGEGQVEIDWVGLQTQLEREIQRMLRRELQSDPLLVLLMQNPLPHSQPSSSTPSPSPSPSPSSVRPALRQRSTAGVAS
ncbi:ribonuclease J [Neosynechococcus sphagnicola sy1]|uniref:Ribonuclease J n=1 Tax=Neosynechococcus sphagnicola sy1 TaxID=1497020 RepID=A0A098TI38_9CYAN|nr:ribonuclease J [Neosynechococcus sphagnicola]KGF72245.1 ribonuclease J [Neosynechococcus sphagnicola sy1]